MKDKRIRIEVRLSQEERDFIVNKAKEEGFTSITAFIKASTRKYVSLNIDTSDYLNLVGETRKIGRNINSLIRDIRFSNVISDKDIVIMEQSLSRIELLLKEDKKEFNNLENVFENLSSKKLKELVEQYDMEVPLSAIYDNIVEMIKDNILFIIDIMKRNKWENHNIEFLYKFVYGLLPDRYNEKEISILNNEIYSYTLSIKNKMFNDRYRYNEQDYINLMDIIDNHSK